MVRPQDVPGFGWYRPGSGGGAGRRYQRLLVVPAVLGTVMLAVAVLPILGVLIAVLFWVVLAAFLVVVCAPAARWVWPRVPRLAIVWDARLVASRGWSVVARWVAAAGARLRAARSEASADEQQGIAADIVELS